MIKTLRKSGVWIHYKGKLWYKVSKPWFSILLYGIAFFIIRTFYYNESDFKVTTLWAFTDTSTRELKTSNYEINSMVDDVDHLLGLGLIA